MGNKQSTNCIIENYKITGQFYQGAALPESRRSALPESRRSALGPACTPNVGQLCPDGTACPQSGMCGGGGPAPPPPPGPPSPAGDAGWCNKNLNCAPGTQCCELNNDKMGCASMGTTEAECSGTWHPIGPPNPCQGKTSQNCNNHGTPTKSRDGKSCPCVCDDGYSGADCSEDVDPCTPNPCQNGGTCVVGDNETHTCECPDDYVGENCQFVKNNCNGHGKVDPKTGDCECDGTFAGPNCQYSDAETCNNNGYAQEDGSCICKDGYSGDNCKISDTYVCIAPQQLNVEGSVAPGLLANGANVGDSLGDNARCIPASLINFDCNEDDDGNLPKGCYPGQAECESSCTGNYSCQLNGDCKLDPNGGFTNRADCEAKCGSSYICDNNQCNSQSGPCRQGQDQCYPTQADCDDKCQNHYDCINNTCESKAGAAKKKNEYSTLQLCEATGCGQSSFACINDLCTKVDDPPDAGKGRFATQAACDAVCGNSFTCSEITNRCVQHKGQVDNSSSSLAACEATGCGEFHYECDDKLKYCVRKFGKANGAAGQFETEDACDQACKNSFGCVENECVQFPGSAKQQSINKYNTRQECTEGGCGNVTYDCAGVGMCIEVPGNDGSFKTEAQCDEKCSNSFGCLQNQCVQFAGGADPNGDNKFESLAECQAEGCGKFYYLCEDQKDGGGVVGQKCVRYEGNPPAGKTPYASEAECNANCSNTFNCNNNVCEEIVGNSGKFDTRQSCEESGCGEMSYKCVNNLSCVKMNKPVDQDDPNDFFTQEECDIKCGNKFECDTIVNRCVEAPGAPYGDLRSCQQEGCGQVYYECKNNQFCEKKNGAKPQQGKVFDSELQCDANCGNSFDCVQNTCIQITGRDGEFATEQECELHGCGTTYFSCLGEAGKQRCVENIGSNPGGAGNFDTKSECDASCENSFNCDNSSENNIRCVQVTGRQGDFQSLRQCQDDGCGKHYYQCDGEMCKKINDKFPANPGLGVFRTEGECDASCGNSFDCVDNVCTQYPGEKTGPYKSLKECEEKGCGDTHFSCIGKRCIEQKGPGTDADYKSRAECDARCGNSFKCSPNGKCVELDGGLGAFNSLAECEASDCEEKYYECRTNPQDQNQKFCVEIQGSNPGGLNRHDTEIECDIACGNSFDCVGNKCEQLSTKGGQFTTQAECEAQGCGKTTYNCDGSRCIPIPGSSGIFETEAACDATCDNSFGCGLNNQCVQYAGNLAAYQNLAACQAGGCGQYHYECKENPQNANQKICTKEVGLPQAGKNHYESELECDIKCGVSFDCVNNECKQFSGKNVGKYNTMLDCESEGCGKTSFKCLDNMCVEVEGEDGGYATENDCDLGCGNSFDCENNQCVQIKGNTGQYNTLAQCQFGGCGKVTYTCDTVRGGGNMCKVVKGAQAGEYESELACDSGCGNSFDCVQNECIERADTNGMYKTHLECEQNGCGVVSYTCTGERCIKEDGPHGAFQTEDECDALCGNSFDCENNKCVQKTGADGQYNTLAQCENSVCEESYWYCDPDKKICTKMFGQKQGLAGEYNTEMECNAACGNSYGCVQNQCQQFSGPPVAGKVNQYQTREQCEQNGCGSTHFSCVSNLCLEFPGAPSKAADFATREECDATCGNSFRCDSVTHQCVQQAGAPRAGEFKTLAQCELDGCEDTYWECENNQMCIKKWGMKPPGAQYHSSEDACEANCGGSYDCVQNSCVERIGDQGEYKTHAECLAVGCGSTSWDCKNNNQCVERPGSGGAYPTQNDCDLACGNSFGCDTATHKCTEYPGQPNANGPNKYGTLLQCEADGCEDSYYLCEANINQLPTCTKKYVADRPKKGDNEYDTEMECNARCGNSFGCLQNQCTQFPGAPQLQTNPYSTRQECQASGCGQTHFSCSADAQGNSLCVELDGSPQAGDFATQIECDLQCNNSFGCGADNKCVQFKGSANQQGKDNPYSSLSECQATQCGKTYFSCEMNSCIEKPGSADPNVPTDFETKALCDATCGNSYGCVVDGTGAKTCTQFSGAPQFPSNPYSTMDQCSNSGCETITYNCVGGERCVLVNGPGGTYNSMAECDDACQTYYDCSEDGTTCVSKKKAGAFNSLTECQNSECGKSYFNCDGSLCTEIIGLNPKGLDDYDTELACNAACGNSFDCVGGRCVQRIGPQGEFETRQQCEAAGCENITYSCRGGRCYEMIYPNGGDYQTEAECDAGCGNTYNCTGNQCTQVVGQDGDHNTLAECQASGCGTVSYVCDDNAVCREVEGNVGLCTGPKPCKDVINPTKTSCDAVGAACIFHFPTIGECDAACGNSYNCGDDNTCQETIGVLGAYDTLAECQASECGKTRFNCIPQNNQCEEVPGINGTYLTQTDCDAQCTNFYTCETNANNQKQCTQGTGQPPANAVIYDSFEECQTSECTYGWKCTDDGCKQESGGRYITQEACEERCHFKCDNTVGGCVRTTDSGNDTFPTRSQCDQAGVCTLWKWKCNPAGNGDCTQTGGNLQGLTEYDNKADCEARCNVKCDKALDPMLGCNVDLSAQPCVPNGDDCFINMDQCVESCANYKFECNQRTGDCEATVNGTYESKDQCEQLCKFSCDASQGQCRFSERGEFPSVADCVANCVVVDLCAGVDCGNGVCVPDDQTNTHTCVCDPCYDTDANGSCTFPNNKDCCEANNGTWANGVCTCKPGWSKGPDGIRCTVARDKCEKGYYKTNIGKGQNGLPFDCERCRNCSSGYQKSVKCSGRGTRDTSECVKSMKYCGTQCTPNDDCTYAGDGEEDCVSCPSGYSDVGWKKCDGDFLGWGWDYKRRCSWTSPVRYKPI